VAEVAGVGSTKWNIEERTGSSDSRV